MGKYVIGIDAGTMGVRCVIFDLEGNEISSAYFETPTVYPKPGWVEQDANDVIELAYKSVAKAIEKKNVDTSIMTGTVLLAFMSNGIREIPDKAAFSNLEPWR